MPEFTILPPLSLYIHLPWCVKKCPYCDFNSHSIDQGMQESRYIDELIADLEYQLPTIWGRRIISVFIGGGTPSLFSVESIERLLSACRQLLNLSPTIEITMEANPGTVEQEKFNGFYAAGINRLSIGIQSFDNKKLLALGRIHDGREAMASVDIARAAGFENINLDLMFGLPQQSAHQGLADLQQAIDLAPQHISWYQLTIEPNTLFYQQPPPIPDDDDIWTLQQQGQQLLADAGYVQYEVSAYAKNAVQCQHNLNYWQFGDYLALGAGAHGKITRSDRSGIQRYWQLRQPRAYMDAEPVAKISETEQLQTSQIVFEFMLNSLRLKQGFSPDMFETHTGLKIEDILPKCEQAISDGLLQRQGKHYCATEKGYLFLNDLINRFS